MKTGEWGIKKSVPCRRSLAAGRSSRIPMRQRTARTCTPTRTGSLLRHSLTDRLTSALSIRLIRRRSASLRFSQGKRFRRTRAVQSFINNTVDRVTAPMASGVRHASTFINHIGIVLARRVASTRHDRLHNAHNTCDGTVYEFQ